jgi:hypothetical protein
MIKQEADAEKWREVGAISSRIRFQPTTQQAETENRVALNAKDFLPSLAVLGLDPTSQQPPILQIVTRTHVNLFDQMHRFHANVKLLPGEDLDLQIDMEAQKSPDEFRIRISGRGSELLGPIVSNDFLVTLDSKRLRREIFAPPDRMQDLQPGKRFKMPVTDPLKSLSAQSIEQNMEDARVSNEIHYLDWNGERLPCLLVETGTLDRDVKIWVRQHDSLQFNGMILRQELRMSAAGSSVRYRVDRLPPGVSGSDRDWLLP